MTPSQLAHLFKFLGASYPRWNITPDTISAYAMGLADCDAEMVFRAAQHHLRTKKWEPSVAELRALVREYAPGPKLPSADEAWQEFRAKWKASSQFDAPPTAGEWSTPLIAVAAKRIPAWHTLRTHTTDDFRWIGRDFRQGYTDALERTRFDETVEAVGELPLPEGIAALMETRTESAR
jgi:hypothetical protein